LSAAVLAWRAGHGLIAVGFLGSIVYVWWCALSGRRGRVLRWAIAALASEGVLVVANGGDCPLGPLGDRIGDAVPLFELVLSPRAAKRAVPTLGMVTVAGLVVLAARRDRFGPRAAGPRRWGEVRTGDRREEVGDVAHSVAIAAVEGGPVVERVHLVDTHAVEPISS